MSEVRRAQSQWPDQITSGDIRYGKASNYDGFYLADASHGIPTFGSVSETSPPTIRGQNVRVFNYPGQTEAIASELVKRWNSHTDLLDALNKIVNNWDNLHPKDREQARAAIAKAEGRS